jgi:hypothetical protein
MDLPDATRKHHRPTFCGPKGIMAKVYCVNCGKDGGAVTAESPILYLCETCAEKYGGFALPEIPEEEIKWR